MANLFLNKFRIESKRKNGHDYSSAGIYFITILTEAQISFFGKIVNGNMVLSPIGQIIYTHWISLPERFSFIAVDEFVIMPNHLHGILIIKQKYKCKDAIYRVSFMY